MLFRIRYLWYSFRHRWYRERLRRRLEKLDLKIALCPTTANYRGIKRGLEAVSMIGHSELAR